MTKEKNKESKDVKQGCLFVISAPSGAGKTTLCSVLLERFDDIAYSVSHTTRKPRPGEKDEVDYFFISEETFTQGIDQGIWAEWAEVHDEYYGTSADFLESNISNGNDIILDIDVQGAEQILAKYPDVITIFIMPPSLDALRERLESRGTDSNDVIETRMKNAEKEMAKKSIYRHIIVNDRLEKAKEELIGIFEKYRK